MKRTWQLQEAKNKFSEVVEQALHDGPQFVTRRGQDAVVVLSAKDYRRLSRSQTSLVDFFRTSPLAGVELDVARSRDRGRRVEL